MKMREIKAAILSHSNRGPRIQDRGDPSQPGGPATEELADFISSRPVLFIENRLLG